MSDYDGSEGMFHLIRENVTIDTYPQCDHNHSECTCAEDLEELLLEYKRRIIEENNHG